MQAGFASAITGAASSVVRDNLTKNVVLVSNDNGKIAPSAVSISQLQGVINGGASSIVDYDLIANKVVISDAEGKITTSLVTNIEVGTLSGITGLIQNQLNSKADLSATYTQTSIDSFLALKQDLIGVDSLEIPSINNLQNSLDILTTNVSLKTDSSLFTTVTNTLDGLILANTGDITALTNNVYTRTEIDSNLLLKQNVLSGGSIWGGGTISSQILDGSTIRSIRHNPTNPLSISVVSDSLDFAVDTYTQSSIDAFLVLKQNVIGANSLQISNINNLQNSLDVLTTDVGLKTNSALFTSVTNSLDALITTNTAGIAGLNASYNNLANSFYTKPEIDSSLSLKQNIITEDSLQISDVNNLQFNLDALTLSNNTGSGIGLLNGDKLRQIIPVSPLSMLITYDFDNPSDPDNNNILLDIDLTSIQTRIDSKQDLLTNGSDITIDLGQGDIYFENNPVNNDGVGLVIRTSDNPIDSPILSVQSSGLASRLWVGQSITSPGSNDFHAGFTGSSGEEHLISNYKHKLTETNATFGTPVVCQYDLSCTDLTASTIYGGAATQIQSLIDTAITNAYPYWIAAKLYSSGQIAVSQGRVGFTSTKVSNGIYDIVFDTIHPRGGNYVVQITQESRSEWTAKTSGLTNQTNAGFRVVLQFHESEEHSSYSFICVLA